MNQQKAKEINKTDLLLIPELDTREYKCECKGENQNDYFCPKAAQWINLAF